MTVWDFACQHEWIFMLTSIEIFGSGFCCIFDIWKMVLEQVERARTSHEREEQEMRFSQERIEQKRTEIQMIRRAEVTHFEQELNRIHALANGKPDGDGWSTAFRRVKEALATHDALYNALLDELCKTDAKLKENEKAACRTLLDFKGTCDENTRLRQQIQDLGDLRTDRDRLNEEVKKLRANGGITPSAFPPIRRGPQCPAVYPDRNGGLTCCVLDRGHSGCHQNGPHWIDGPPTCPSRWLHNHCIFSCDQDNGHGGEHSAAHPEGGRMYWESTA